ncbi:MAG: hypothetical protein ACE5KX_07265 [Acidimicrobiia bacterium]
MKKWPFVLSFLALFALAMGYVEAGVVVYLRQLQWLPGLDWLTAIEVGREAATLVMLFALGWLAGWDVQSRLGGAIFAWGLWDLAYYAWLKVFISWPTSMGEWDLLFLIPLPWWGPVWAPLLGAALMLVVGGGLVVRSGQGIRARVNRAIGLAGGIGTLLALSAVLAPALRSLPGGLEAAVRVLPVTFAWPVYIAGWGLVAAASWRMLRAR